MLSIVANLYEPRPAYYFTYRIQPASHVILVCIVLTELPFCFRLRAAETDHAGTSFLVVIRVLATESTDDATRQIGEPRRRSGKLR